VTLPTVRLLISYYGARNTDITTFPNSYAGKLEIFADSGAFSAATLGATIDIRDYMAWLTTWAPLLTVTSSLDVIGDAAGSRVNFERLREAGHAVLPVFHVGSDFAELERLCATYGYIALGGMVPHTGDPGSVAKWLIRCFRIGREHGTVFHGFGQTNTKIINDFPFYSVDSSSWGSGPRYGNYTVWNHEKRAIQRIPHGDLARTKKYAQFLTECGTDPGAFARADFALKGEKSSAEYQRERITAYGVSACAWLTYSRWLERHHRVPAPLGFSGTGTLVYLAESNSSDVIGTLRYLSEALTSSAGRW
jgi:hypothetical protein